MRALHRLFGATCFVLAFTPSPAGAQQDLIPKELALALIPVGASEGGEIIVGKLAPDLAGAFTLPPGGRVLGSFVSLGYGQAVIAFPGSADSANAFVRRALTEHGWVARSPRVMRMGGLQYGPRVSVPTVFCKAGQPEELRIATQFYGREALVRLTRSGSVGTCDQPVPGVSATRAERAVFMSMSGSPYVPPFASLPPLWSPGDPSSSIRTCRPANSYNGGMQSQEQPVRTELSPDEILAYYGKQLDSAGWRSDSQGQSVTRTWAKANAARDSTQELTLTVSKMSIPGCYEVQLRAAVQSPTR
jgi:hypothetical protein